MTGRPRVRSRVRSSVLAIAATALVASTGRAQTPVTEDKLPEPVAKTFRAAFPKAEIQKLDVEKEEGVDVYDFEFKDGDVEKETDIAGDGTMMESTVVIAPEAVPAAAMKTIQAVAKKATLGGSSTSSRPTRPAMAESSSCPRPRRGTRPR